MEVRLTVFGELQSLDIGKASFPSFTSVERRGRRLIGKPLLKLVMVVVYGVYHLIQVRKTFRIGGYGAEDSTTFGDLRELFGEVAEGVRVK
jgi:hypothetical protein